jgi:hypothetical protein
MKKVFLIFIALFSSLAVSHAAEKWSVDKLSEWKELDSDCKNSIDPAAHKIICEKREKVSHDLSAKGYCFGKTGQDKLEFSWHRCDKDSVH